MLENEDSVVTSLNELRKLKHERITRQTQTRAAVGAGRAAALAVDPASDQMTPPPASMSPSYHSSRGALQHSPAQNANEGFGSGFALAPSSYAPSPPIVQTKTSVKAAVFVAIVLIGAGGAGYMKLQADTQAMLAAKDAAIKQAEETRSRATEMAAKTEIQARTSLRQCEDKLRAAMAVAPAAPTPAMPSAPVVEKKPEAVAKMASHPSSHKVAAHSSRRAASAEPAAPKADAVPTIAKKKKLDNDPLAGLNKL